MSDDADADVDAGWQTMTLGDDLSLDMVRTVSQVTQSICEGLDKNTMRLFQIHSRVEY